MDHEVEMDAPGVAPGSCWAFDGLTWRAWIRRGDEANGRQGFWVDFSSDPPVAMESEDEVLFELVTWKLGQREDLLLGFVDTRRVRLECAHPSITVSQEAFDLWYDKRLVTLTDQNK